MSAPVRFSFLDEGEALRRLGVDRDTLLTFVREKRLRAYPGVGKGNFYRLKDIDALNAELHAEAASPAAAETGEGEGAPASGRKVFDPAYKVHVRLQADLKWYDLEDDDLKAWVRELHEDGYPRQRSNITSVIARLQRLVDLMDEAAAGWQTLKPGLPARPATAVGAADTAGESAAAESKPRRKTLPMFTGGQTPPPMEAAPQSPPATATASTTTKMRGRNLPMATLPQRPSAPQGHGKGQAEQNEPTT